LSVPKNSRPSNCLFLETLKFYLPSTEDIGDAPSSAADRADLTHVDTLGKIKFGAPGRLIILHPLKPTLFRLFRPRTGLANPLLVSAQIVDSFKQILSHVET